MLRVTDEDPRSETALRRAAATMRRAAWYALDLPSELEPHPGSAPPPLRATCADPRLRDLGRALLRTALDDPAAAVHPLALCVTSPDGAGARV
jgi:hypothetical protein